MSQRGIIEGFQQYWNGFKYILNLKSIFNLLKDRQSKKKRKGYIVGLVLAGWVNLSSSLLLISEFSCCSIDLGVSASVHKLFLRSPQNFKSCLCRYIHHRCSLECMITQVYNFLDVIAIFALFSWMCAVTCTLSLNKQIFVSSFWWVGIQEKCIILSMNHDVPVYMLIQ